MVLRQVISLVEKAFGVDAQNSQNNDLKLRLSELKRYLSVCF